MIQTGEALAAALEHLNTVVQPHLDDEEQKVVPLAAVTLTQQEWDAMGKSGISKIPRKKRAIAFGMMLDALDGRADRQARAGPGAAADRPDRPGPRHQATASRSPAARHSEPRRT